MLDGSGFIRRSEVFEGSVFEGKTLQGMLKALNAPRGALVVMDAGIASEDNITWLSEQGFKYLVVSRQHKRVFDQAQASQILSACGHEIYLHRQQAEPTGDATDEGLHELTVACWSEQGLTRIAKLTPRRRRFESGLRQLNEGLSKKGLH